MCKYLTLAYQLMPPHFGKVFQIDCDFSKNLTVDATLRVPAHLTYYARVELVENGIQLPASVI